MANRELKVTITGDAKSLQRALNQSEDRVSKFQKASGAALAKFGGAVAGAFAVGAMVEFGKASIEVASDINESLTKNQVLFGSYSKTIENFSKSAADSFGISKQAALEYTGVFGNLSRAIGISKKDSAEMSVRLTKLAADLASFNNTSIDDALEALRSGLVGETEPLRRFGVTLSANAVAAEAMRSGLVKVKKESFDYRNAVFVVDKAQLALNKSIKEHGKNSLDARGAALQLERAQQAMAKAAKGGRVELTAEQKALATVHLIMRQTSAAHGDFARTSAGAANQQRILQAQIKNLQAELGAKLLPIQRDVTRALVNFIRQMQEGKGAGGALAGAVRTLVKVYNALEPVLKVVATVFATQVKVIYNVEKALLGIYRTITDKILGAFSTMLDTIGDVAGAARHIPGIGGWAGKVSDDAHKAARSINAVRDSFKGAKTAIDQYNATDIKNTTVPATPRGDNKPPGRGGAPKKPRTASTGGTHKMLPGSTITAHAAGEAGGAEYQSLSSALNWVHSNFPGLNAFIENPGTQNQHLHINGDPGLIIKAGQGLKAAGYAVGEYSGSPSVGFGPITTTHKTHGGGQGIDVNSDYRSLSISGGGGGGGSAGTRTSGTTTARPAPKKPKPPPVIRIPNWSWDANFQPQIDAIDLRVSAGQLGVNQANARKRRVVRNALKILTGRERLKALTALNAIEDDTGDLSSTLTDVPATAPEASTFAQQQHDGSLAQLGDILDNIDAQVRAGDMTAEQGRDKKINVIGKFIKNAGSLGLTGTEVLNLRGDIKELEASDTGASTADLIATLNALKDEISKQNAHSDAVLRTNWRTAIAALADTISGEIAGYSGYLGKAATAGAGSTYRL